ncbi:trypsin-like peptidase domain-containing protein [Streptomyces sp. C36]|uniref:nSTAND1 domain-containing NTPase n=1 Tax=Streptomyces sp. C36 TaxID=3237122 RepID=UPI0034C66C72
MDEAPVVTPREADCASAVARIDSTAGVACGGGLLVSSDTVITCAHVVAQALALPEDAQERPSGAVKVAFPLTRTGPASARVREDGWFPIAADGSGDVAVLRLEPEVDEPRPLQLVTGQSLWNHGIRAYGFPTEGDEAGGAYARGTLLGRTAVGWVQIDDVRPSGIPVGPGFSGTPVWDVELGGIVGIAVARTRDPALRTSYMIPVDTLIRSWPRLRDLLPPPHCPYKGLHPFREGDELFGRTETVERLAARVTRAGTLAVVGPSAVGKSSLVHAGVARRLRERYDCLVVSFRPETDTRPAAPLAGALLPYLEPSMSEVDRQTEVPKLASVLASGGLQPVVSRILALTRARRLVLVIDQFEQLLATWQEETAALVRQLPGRDGQAGGQRTWHAVVVLRSDYLDAALSHRGVADALAESVFPVVPPSAASLLEVVEGPVAGTSVFFEEGLATRMVEEVSGESGALALLQFTLTQLWETRQNGWITHRAYDAAGGVLGALATHAERVHAHELSDADRTLAPRLFTQLVRPDQQGRHTRRLVRRTSVPTEVWAFAMRLLDSRLLTADRTAEGEEVVELVHEELIRRWGRLRRWVEEDLDFRTWQENLRHALHDWQRDSRDSGRLLKAADLREASRRVEERAEDLSPPEREYIALSVAHDRRTRRVRRAAIGTVGLIVVTALVLGALFLQQHGVARTQQAIAASRALASAADGNSRALSEPTLTNLLSIAAYQAHPTPEAYANLFGRYLDTHDYERVLDVPDQSGVQLTTDGRFAVALGREDGVRTWDLHSSRPVRRDLPGSGFGQVDLSPDGTKLVTTHRKRVVVWDLAQHTAISDRTIEPAPVSVRFTGDGALVVLRADHKTVSVAPADVASGRLPPPGVAVPAEGLDAILGRGPSPTTLVVRHAGAVAVWDRGTGAFRNDIKAGKSALVSGDGRVLADVMCENTDAGGSLQRVRTWDLTTGKAGGSFTSGDLGCRDRGAVRLDTRGRYLLISTPTAARLMGYTPRTSLSVWGVTTGRLTAMRVLPTRGLKWIQAAVDTGRPDELLLAIDQVTSVGILRLGLRTLESLPQSSITAEPSPRGHYLATVSHSVDDIADVQLRLWDPLGRRTISATASDHTLAATARMVFTRDEKHLITTTSEPNDVIVWSIPELRQEHRITLPTTRRAPRTGATPTPELAVDSEEHLLASCEGLISRWDPRTGRAAGTPGKVQDTAGVNTVVDGAAITPRLAARPNAAQYATAVKGSAHIGIHDTTTGALRATLDLPAGTDTTDLHYAGDRLRALAADGTLHTWDAAHGYAPSSDMRLPASSRLTASDRLAVGDGQQLAIWNLLTRTRERAIPLETSPATLAPTTGHLLYGASFDDQSFVGHTRRSSWAVLPLAPATWIAHLCRISSRTTLTPAELRSAPAGTAPHPTCV